MPLPAKGPSSHTSGSVPGLAASKVTSRRAVDALLRLADAAKNSRAREAAVAGLLRALEAAVGAGSEDCDVVCVLDALRAVAFAGCRQKTLDGVVERAFLLASAKQALSVDAEDEGWLLDFVNDGLDAGARYPTASDVEAAVRVKCSDAATATTVERFFRDGQGLLACAARCSAARAAGARRLVYGPAADDDDDLGALVAEVRHVADAYVRERAYGIKQHLLARCLLLGRFSGNQAKVRARDAWKCLRTKDDRTKSAVLELLDTDLPPRLKPLVTPILDPAARDKASASRAAPLQISGAVSAWLRCAKDALGDELADAVDLLFGSDEAAVPAPAERGILAAVSLLHVARPFEHALVSQHLAVLAEHCRLRRVGAESFAAQGESYVVCAGRVLVERRTGPPRVAARGESFQDWHALGGVAGWDLPVLAATGHPDATVLVVDGDALKRSMDGVSPKFVFALLRALVTSLPEASQAGGGRIAKHLGRDRADSVALEENGALEAAASAAAPPQVLAPLEKVLLLRDAKMLRFVPERFLATLADVADVRAVPPRRVLARGGGKTDAALHVLADGAIELEIGDRCSAVLDEPSASFGNTGLLADHTWPYTARAGVDGAVLLSLSRSRLHDALRGRRDLAAAVAHGFLRTLGRRALAAHVADEPERSGTASPDRRARKKPKGVAAARADYATGTSPQINMAFSPRDAAAGPPFFALGATDSSARASSLPTSSPLHEA